MSGERSYLEHNGMPLMGANKSRSVQRTQPPWLASFAMRPAAGVEEQKLAPPFPLLPETESMQDSPETASPPAEAHNLSDPFVPAAALGRLPRRSVATGPAAPAPGSMAGAVATGGQTSSTRAAAGATKDHAMPGGGQVSKDGVGFVRKVAGTMVETLREEASPDRAGAALRPPMAVPGSGGGREVASVSPPQVITKKHINIEAVMLPAQPAAGNPPAGPDSAVEVTLASHAAQAVASPREIVAGAGRVHFAERFAELAPEKTVHPALASMEMGGGTNGKEQVRIVIPAMKFQGDRSRQEILETLDQRPQAPPERGGRRVQIRNLHITVQKPALTVTTPSLPPSAPPQPAAAAQQTFVNPWERHVWTLD